MEIKKHKNCEISDYKLILNKNTGENEDVFSSGICAVMLILSTGIIL